MSKELLNDDEQLAMQQAAELWNTLCRVVGDGVTRNADLRELMGHIHGIQHAVMAQAAARAYPDDYRLLGQQIGDE